MARRVNEKKLLQWREHLAEFEGSGLSVAAFCRKQKITPTQFYYWMRRVREAGSVSSKSTKLFDVEKSPSEPSEERARVEIFIGQSVRVSLPTSAPELISSVMQRLQESSKQASAFELVDVVPSR